MTQPTRNYIWDIERLAWRDLGILPNVVTDIHWKLSCVDLFKHGKIHEARKLLCDQARPEDMNEVYRWMYDNLDLWSKTPEGQDEAIMIIRKALVNVAFVADQEINLAACLVELTQIEK